MNGVLTLNEALKTNRLDDFIAQAEAAGVEAADREMFDRVVRSVTEPQPEGQTVPIRLSQTPTRYSGVVPVT